MVDAHTHLDKYGEKLPEALAQIRESSILTLAVSMDVSSYRETERIASHEPLILPSFGIHPWMAPRFAGKLEVLDSFLETASLYGEVGLDHFFMKDEAEYPLQREVFAYFVSAAEQRGRIMNVHLKGAEAAVLEHLQGRTLPGVIIHWYSGPLDLVSRFLDLGAYFTVGVEVLRSDHIRALARAIPDDRLLSETDNPGGWEWMMWEPGFPHLLARVEEVLSEIRGVSREVLSAQIAENTRHLLAAGGIELPPDVA